MSIKLSHSAVNRYLGCPKEYDFHYRQNYRPKVQSSALLFGTAIDKATEHYVNTKDFDATLSVFNQTWQEQEINKVKTDLRTLLNFTYSDRDLDLDLLNSDDLEDISLTCELKSTNALEEIDRVLAKKKQVGYKYLKKNEKLLFNYTNWLSLKHKGYYMLVEAKKVIDEILVETLGTQVAIDLENEQGDKANGFADLVARVKKYDKPVVLDFKTSSRDYEDDSVKTSPQLSLYVFSLREKYENTNLGGYIVLNKNMVKIRTKICSSCGYNGTGKTHKTCDNLVDAKRCHGSWNETLSIKARSQVIIDEVSERIVNHTVDNFNEVSKGIKAEIFPRNLNNCIRYGTLKCSFFDICHNNNYDDVEKKS